MRDFVIPQNTQPQVQEAFQQIREILRTLRTPLLKEKASLRGIPEGSAALFVDDGLLYRYTKVNGKLFREPVDDRVIPEQVVSALATEEVREIAEEESRSLDDAIVINSPGITHATANTATKIIKPYIVGSQPPTEFVAKWYANKQDYIDRVEQPANEAPTDVSFSPSTPATERGEHEVIITFTPRTRSTLRQPAVLRFEVN